MVWSKLLMPGNQHPCANNRAWVLKLVETIVRDLSLSKIERMIARHFKDRYKLSLMFFIGPVLRRISGVGVDAEIFR